jgi:hypothetical protein
MSEHSVRLPHGHIIIADPDGPTVERDTLSCVHCGGHWEVIPGSGRRRGWCMKCAGPHCGAPTCWECRPYKKLIDEGHW